MASARSRRLFLKRNIASSARRACCSTLLLSHANCEASDNSDCRFVPLTVANDSDRRSFPGRPVSRALHDYHCKGLNDNHCIIKKCLNNSHGHSLD
jgi:hypothetical protein